MKKILLACLLLFTINFTLKAGSGGPDTFGYTWTDSDTTGGPTFNWVDIELEANRILGLGDDNVVGPFTISGGFSYYWYTINNLFIGSNGYISFASNNISSPFPLIPNTAGANNYMAALLSDLNFTGAGNPASCFFYDDADSTIISWVNVPFWTTVAPGYTGDNSFQIILNKADSSITYNYKRQQGLTQANDITIGIENITGDMGLMHSFDTYPDSSYSIRFDYPDSVLVSVTDAGAIWNSAPLSKGIFLPVNGDPFGLTSNIRNTGNQPLGSFTAVNNILDGTGGMVQNDAVTINPLDPLQDTTINFSSSFTPSSEDIYSNVTYLTGIPGDMSSSNDTVVQEIVAVDSSGPMTLAYHDQTPEGGGISWSGGDGGLAVYFVPPVYPVRIVATKYRIEANGTPAQGFSAIVYDDDGPDGGPGTILDSAYVPGTQAIAGTTVDVNPAGNVVIDDGGVYVLWEQDGPDVTLSTDLTPPFSFHTSEVISGIWADYRSSDVTDFFISMDVEINKRTDYSVSRIDSPQAGEFVTSPTVVKAWIKNYGEAPLTSLNVNYQITGGSVQTQLYSGPTLNTGDSALVTFNSLLSSAEPNAELCVWSGLLNDDSTSNDTVCIMVNPSEPGDIGVVEIKSPSEGSVLTAPTDVTVTIENFGSTDAGLFNIFYQKGAGGSSELYAGDAIPPGGKVDYTFSTQTTTTSPNEELCSWTEKGNDTNFSNDTTCITLHEVSGIETIQNELMWNVYPNPSQNEVHFSSNGYSNEPVQITITSVLGQEMLNSQIQTATMSLNTSKWATGVYLYTISSGHESVTGKIVIAR